MKIFLSFLYVIFPLFSLAESPNVGMIIKRQGKAELLTNPSKKLNGQKNPVLYEGMYYEVKKIRPGLKVKNKNIVRTGKDSKVKVVFKNGDQFNVGEATAYTISWNKNPQSDDKGSTVGVIYGSIRGIISKKGPRNKLKVKSRSAVMGVRGTDFHFYQKGTSGDSLISVIRGKVEVAPTEAPKQIRVVKQGFSAETKSKPLEVDQSKKKDPPKTAITLVQTSKNDLVFIQKDSSVKTEPEDQKLITPEIEKEIKILNDKAKEVTLTDIKTYQPEVYEQLKTDKSKTVHEINTTVVKNAFKQAPIKKKKKGFDELIEDLDDDAYEKYFKSK